MNSRWRLLQGATAAALLVTASGGAVAVTGVTPVAAAAAFTIVRQSPASGGLGVDVSSKITIDFSAPIQDSWSMNVTEAGSTVSGRALLDPDGTQLTFTPAKTLDKDTDVTVAVHGLRSVADVSLPDARWSFHTKSIAADAPETLFGDVVPAATANSTDGKAVELGVAFAPTRVGRVTAIRFFKGAGNTGRHTGTIWSSAGKKLASVRFRDETANGWQTATLEAPLLLMAGSTYVVSYHAPHGHYAFTGRFFGKPSVSGDLTAPATDNGRFVYGAGFPTASYQATNYFVDVVFSPGLPVTTRRPAPSAAPSGRAPSLTTVPAKPTAPTTQPVHGEQARSSQPTQTGQAGLTGRSSASSEPPTHAGASGATTSSPTPSADHPAGDHDGPKPRHTKTAGHHSAGTGSSHSAWPRHGSSPFSVPVKLSAPARSRGKPDPTSKTDERHGRHEHGREHEQQPARRHDG